MLSRWLFNLLRLILDHMSLDVLLKLFVVVVGAVLLLDVARQTHSLHVDFFHVVSFLCIFVRFFFHFKDSDTCVFDTEAADGGWV